MVSRAILNGWPLVPPSAVTAQGGDAITPPTGYRIVQRDGLAKINDAGLIYIREAA